MRIIPCSPRDCLSSNLQRSAVSFQLSVPPRCEVAFFLPHIRGPIRLRHAIVWTSALLATSEVRNPLNATPQLISDFGLNGQPLSSNFARKPRFLRKTVLWVPHFVPCHRARELKSLEKYKPLHFLL